MENSTIRSNQIFNYRPLAMAALAIALLTPVLMVKFDGRYFMNYSAIGSLVASYFIGVLGIVIAGQGFEQPERKSLFLLSLCFFFWLWTAGIGGLCRSSEASLATWWFKLGNLAVVVIATQTYVFTTKFLKIQRRTLIVIGYALAVVFSIINLTTNLIVEGVHFYSWGFYPRWHVPYCIPFFVYFGSYLTMSLIEYARAKRQTENRRVKNQINYLLFAFACSYLGSVDYLPALGYNVFPFGFVAVMAWWTILATAILKHRLLDISVIVRKTVIYSTVMATLTVIYLGTLTIFARIFQGLTGYQSAFSSAIAASLLTLGFQPLRKRVQGFVDSKFFRQYVDREEKLYELSREVITHTTPETMAQALIRVLGETLHPKSGTLYLRSRDGTGFTPTGSWGTSNSEKMSEDNALARYFTDHPQPFVQELPNDIGQSHNTRGKTDRGDIAA